MLCQQLLLVRCLVCDAPLDLAHSICYRAHPPDAPIDCVCCLVVCVAVGDVERMLHLIELIGTLHISPKDIKKLFAILTHLGVACLQLNELVRCSTNNNNNNNHKQL
jgi:hypothetical protein